MDDTLSFAEAQAYLGISRPTLFRWLQDGRLNGLRLGRAWRFRTADLDALLKPGTRGLIQELEEAIQHYKRLGAPL